MRTLVTGEASGLGAALAETLLAKGHAVTVIDRDAAGMKTLSPAVDCIVADLGDTGLYEQLTEDLAGGGPFDVVILNAGVSASGAFETISAQAHRRVIDINLVAPITLATVLIQKASIRDNGSLILISSLSHLVGYPGASVYAGTKDGIAILARSLGKALRARRINVLAVMPGPLDTPHAQRYAPPGASQRGRMPPAVAAARIAARIGSSGVLLPGAKTGLAGMLGLVFPGLATAIVRRNVFEKFAAPVPEPEGGSSDITHSRRTLDATGPIGAGDA